MDNVLSVLLNHHMTSILGEMWAKICLKSEVDGCENLSKGMEH